MKQIVARVSLSSITPYSQSRFHNTPKEEGESPADYNMRTWREQLTVKDGHIVIPAMAMKQAIVAGAKYSGVQIPGKGKATWTAKFERGTMIIDDIDTGLTPDDAQPVDIYCNADGVRGSGKRVMRRFPIMNQWSATFDVYVLEPMITEEVFSAMLEQAGMFIGIGRFRPEKGGTNGRFKTDALDWIVQK